VTANVIGPGGLTRISSTMPGAEVPQEFDPTDGAEFDPRDPTLSAPVVAWLASPEAAYVSGQVIKAFGENIQLMGGWTPEVTLNNGGQRWDATKLGSRFAIDVFKTRAPGLRLG
jgi:NAD(P)-dependent dehydrogenase (short-subunit alcohol dehydrogenase family)